MLLAASLVLSCARHKPIQPVLEFKTAPILLDTIPETIDPKDLQFSPDGTEVAYRWNTGDGRQGYAVNGRVERYFDEVGEFLHYTKDGTHYAYKAKKAFKELVMFDGTEGEMYDQVTDPALSVTGRALAYAAKKGEQAFVVFNDQEGAKDFDLVGPPILSPDGKRIAYAAKQFGKWFYVLDGRQEKPFDEVGYAYFGDDARSFAYEARRGLKWVIVIDGEESPEYDAVGLYPETPWRRVFSAKRDGKEFVVDGGKEGPAYDKVGWPVVSENGKKIAYEARRDGKRFIVWEGREGKPYDQVGRPILTRNGKGLAYDAMEGRQLLMVRDEGEIKRYVALPGARFSPDGTKLAYAGVNRDATSKFVVEENVKGKDYETTGLIAWSPNGGHLAYAAGEGGKEFLVVDGKEGKAYDRILSLVPRFSPDGKFVGANAMKGREVWWIVEAATDAFP